MADSPQDCGALASVALLLAPMLLVPMMALATSAFQHLTGSLARGAQGFRGPVKISCCINTTRSRLYRNAVTGS